MNYIEETNRYLYKLDEENMMQYSYSYENFLLFQENEHRLQRTESLTDESGEVHKSDNQEYTNPDYKIKCISAIDQEKLRGKWIGNSKTYFSKIKSHRDSKLMFQTSNFYLNKIRTDGIRKKIMSNFLNKATRCKLNEILKANFCNLKIKKFKFSFITKVDLYSVKNVLKKTLLEIYLMDNNDNNVKVICKKYNEIKNFKMFLNQTFEQAYENYLSSCLYSLQIDLLKLRESSIYINEYKRQSVDFLKYYKSYKPN